MAKIMNVDYEAMPGQAGQMRAHGESLNAEMTTAYKSIADLNTTNDSQIRQHMLNLTQEITHLCDHYKTR